jgi:hypothetical protein
MTSFNKMKNFSKKQILSVILLSILIVITTAFISGYAIGQTIGYENGKSENDVIFSNIIKNFSQNPKEFKNIFASKNAKYTAFGEIVEMNKDYLKLINIFGVERMVTIDTNINLADLKIGDRIFVIGQPLENGNLKMRFYKDMPITKLINR